MAIIGKIFSKKNRMNAHLIRFVKCFSIIYVADLCIWTKLLNKVPNHQHVQSIRWFFLHAFTNFIIALCAFSGFVSFLKDPLGAFENDEFSEHFLSKTSKWPLTFAVALHVFHCCSFKLTSDDMFHHFVFMPTIGIPGMIYDWGCLCNWLVFYVCGIPGGIDYIILGAQKLGKLQSLNQKRICANMNVWFRMPGTLFGASIAYALFTKKLYTVPTWALIVQLIFLSLNVLYYTKQAVINYTLHAVKTFVPHTDWKVLKKIQ